jgi:hypothetical protein
MVILQYLFLDQKKAEHFMKLKIWIEGRMEIIHIILILTVGIILKAFILKKRQQPRQDF